MLSAAGSLTAKTSLIEELGPLSLELEELREALPGSVLEAVLFGIDEVRQCLRAVLKLNPDSGGATIIKELHGKLENSLDPRSISSTCLTRLSPDLLGIMSSIYILISDFLETVVNQDPI